MTSVCSYWVVRLPSARPGRPAVIVQHGLIRPDVDHRLNRKRHAFADFRSPVRRSEVQYFRWFVHLAANAVANVVANDQQTFRFHVRLNRVANV